KPEAPACLAEQRQRSALVAAGARQGHACGIVLHYLGGGSRLIETVGIELLRLIARPLVELVGADDPVESFGVVDQLQLVAELALPQVGIAGAGEHATRRERLAGPGPVVELRLVHAAPAGNGAQLQRRGG